MEEQLKVLQSRRQYVFQDMQILYDLSIEIERDSSKLRQFNARYKRIEPLREEYVQICNDINMLILKLKPESSIDMKCVSAFDDLYYAVVATNFVDAETDTPAAMSATTYLPPVPQIRLPKIELVKFEGSIECWQTFYDTFVCMVHENKNLSSIEKFHYLLSCLSGSALSIAKGIPVTADNYRVVLDALKERYDNKRVLSATYLDRICNYPTIKSGNLQELRKLTDVLNESVNALKAIKIKNLGEYVLFYLTSRILDSDTRKRFEIQNTEQIPSFEDLLTFLQNYVKVLESSELSKPLHSTQKSVQQSVNLKMSPRYTNKQNSGNNNYVNKSALFTTNKNINIDKNYNNNKNHICLCCGATHSIYSCTVFHNLSYSDKITLITKNNLCKNCLRKNHNENQCYSKTGCLSCGLRHHTLLHPASDAVQGPSSTINAIQESTQTNTHVEHSRAMVLLGTCTVRVRNNGGTGDTLYLKALIDSGAQDCFLSFKCAKRLGLPIRRCNVAVAGLGQNTVHQVRGTTSCTILPRDSNTPAFHISPIVMDNITSKMPTADVPLTVRESYKHLVLADENFDKPSEVDLLIGAELFHNIYDGQTLEAGPGLPVALHSVFGWVITGRLDPECRPPSTVTSLLASTYALDEVVKRFWEIEEPPKVLIPNPEDIKCEQIYTEQVSRNPDGRYVVPILLKESMKPLGESHKQSLTRLQNLEKRLLRHEQLKVDYTNFMREYQSLGHMQPINSPKFSGKYLIPHHCVIRPDSSTTKLRVVFDASAKTTNGMSLNDIVYVGPKLQNDIVDIITKFRLHEIVFTADISKMYRNIDLKPEDRCWQHILWRESPNDSVQEFELNTVTYGVSSSPYLAIRTLHQLAEDHGSQYPHAAQILRHDTFMDDITAGASSIEEALNLKDELVQLLDCAKFELRKWSSNSVEFLSQLPSEHCQVPKSFCDDTNQQTLKILGIQWEPIEDFFTYSCTEPKSKCTKRSILSSVARIYDPLGWLTPVVLLAKLLLQTMWRLKLDWDETVPSDIAQEWQEFVADLKHLKEIRLPRVITSVKATQYELIGFCDGSTKAFGSCVYLRVIGDTETRVHLLIAKAKVAPLKPLTVNRLELCGAVLLARILSHMQNLLKDKLQLANVIAFTDSKTVLSWLNTEPYKLKTFVAHRVVKIIDSVKPENWYHVSTEDNPADHCSRGISCLKLTECPSWWSGPVWLSKEFTSWPIQNTTNFTETVPELKSIALSTVACDITEPEFLTSFISQYSSLTRAKRVLAWCLRFINNLKRKPEMRFKSGLTTNELENSIHLLVRNVQFLSLENELNAVRSNKCCPRSVAKLNPFIDEAGLLRVGGRLKNAQLPLNTKHPLLLPKDSHLSILIIDHYHKLYLHCGPRTLQSLIQRQFWILGIRNLIRSRLSKCVTCFKVQPISCQPRMGDLPSPRVCPSRCFKTVGIDFAGPIIIKESRRRNARTYKAYVCIFVCLATKAVHIELVTELSTPAFLAALDRFVSRRGLCNLIITDNGTNFIGAKRYLEEMQQFLLSYRSEIESDLTNRGITWKLNPVTGSHFGGIFESGVRSIKYHLKRVVGSQIFTYEEFLTVLNKIEAILNSRPLCFLSTDPCEVDVLTPGHFLTGGPLVSLPEPELTEVNVSPLKRWQLLQKLTQCFWRAWQMDYLHTLQQRLKWFNDQANVKIGSVVMIVEQNLSPLDWRYGRVETIHPGADGVVRVVTLRTQKGLVRRPVTKICPLPIQ